MPFKHTTTDRYRPGPPYGRLVQRSEPATYNRQIFVQVENLLPLQNLTNPQIFAILYV